MIMTTNFKSILLFVGGIGVGAVGATIIVRKHYEDRAAEDIASVKEYYKDQLDDALGRLAIANTLISEQEEDTTAIKPATAEIDPDDMPDDPIERIRYRIKAGAAVEEEEMTPQEAEEMAGEPPVVSGKLPYVISDRMFADDHREFDKRTLTYFSEDEIFMDVESEEVLSNGLTLIGMGNMDRFGEYEEDVLFVRNPEEATDFEIILELRAYGDSEYAM